MPVPPAMTWQSGVASNLQRMACCAGRLFSSYRGFGKLALQRTTVHVECAGGGRDIVAVLMQHTLDMFPLQVFDLRRLRLDWRVAVGDMAECRHDFIRIGRFGEILCRAQLDGL